MKIIHVHNHYEAYDKGNFVCSGDTYGEVEREIESMKEVKANDGSI